MPSETKTLPCGAIVERYKIIGTDTTVYRAYRPTTITGAHSSFTHFDGECFGDVATERPSADIDALPAMSTARFVAVSNWYAAKHAEAYRLIFDAYPCAMVPGRHGMRQDTGAVEIYG